MLLTNTNWKSGAHVACTAVLLGSAQISGHVSLLEHQGDDVSVGDLTL